MLEPHYFHGYENNFGGEILPQSRPVFGETFPEVVFSAEGECSALLQGMSVDTQPLLSFSKNHSCWCIAGLEVTWRGAELLVSVHSQGKLIATISSMSIE